MNSRIPSGPPIRRAQTNSNLPDRSTSDRSTTQNSRDESRSTFTRSRTQTYVGGASGAFIGGASGFLIGGLAAGPPGAVIGSIAAAGGAGYAGARLGSARDRTKNAAALREFVSELSHEYTTIKALVDFGQSTYERRWEPNLTTERLHDMETIYEAIVASLHRKIASELARHEVREVDVNVLVRLLVNVDVQNGSTFLQDAYPILAQVDGIPQIRNCLQALCTNHVPSSNTFADSSYRQRLETVDVLLSGAQPRLQSLMEIAATFSASLGLNSPHIVTQILLGVAAAAQHINPALVGPAMAVGASLGAHTRNSSSSGTATQRRDRQRFTDVHEAFKQQSQSQVRSLPPSVGKKIADVDYDIARAIGADNLSLAKHLMRRRQGLLLGFAIRAKSLLQEEGDNPAALSRIKRIDKAVKKLLEEYSHIENLGAYIDAIRDNSRTYGIGATRIQIFLVGGSGVGKSHFVERLATALELPFIKENLRTVSDLDAIKPSPSFGGMKTSSFQFNAPEVSDKELLTVIPNALVNAGCTNPIIFFDEAGEMMSSPKPMGHAAAGFYGRVEDGTLARLKSILQEGTQTIDSPWMFDNGMSMPYGHANLIFAGNVEPEDKALRERLTIIEFPPLPAQRKRAIAHQAIDTASRGAAGMGKTAIETIRFHAMAHLDLLIELDTASRKPGAHTLKRAVFILVRNIRVQVERTGVGKLSGIDVRRLLHDEFGLNSDGVLVTSKSAVTTVKTLRPVATFRTRESGRAVSADTVTRERRQS